MIEKTEIGLWRMYIHSGIRELEKAGNADGVTILRTAEKEYCFPVKLESDFVSPMLKTLEAAGDTRVLYLVHMWKNHWLDMPAYDLRKGLVTLCPENRDAQLMLIGENGFVIRTIEETMH